MAVERRELAAVVDDHRVAVAALHARERDDAGRRGMDRFTLRGVHVDAGVDPHGPEDRVDTRTEPVGDRAGHRAPHMERRAARLAPLSRREERAGRVRRRLQARQLGVELVLLRPDRRDERLLVGLFLRGRVALLLLLGPQPRDLGPLLARLRLRVRDLLPLRVGLLLQRLDLLLQARERLDLGLPQVGDVAQVLRPGRDLVDVVDVEHVRVHRREVVRAVHRGGGRRRPALRLVELTACGRGLVLEVDRAGGELVDLGLQRADARLDVPDLAVELRNRGVEVLAPGPDPGELAQGRGFVRAGLADRLLQLLDTRVRLGRDPVRGRGRDDTGREDDQHGHRPDAGVPHTGIVGNTVTTNNRGDLFRQMVQQPTGPERRRAGRGRSGLEEAAQADPGADHADGGADEQHEQADLEGVAVHEVEAPPQRRAPVLDEPAEDDLQPEDEPERETRRRSHPAPGPRP